MRRLLMVAAGLSLATFTAVWESRIAAQSIAEPRRVWTGPRLELRATGTPPWALGAISPDGAFLSFVDWSPGGNGELAIHDLRTGSDRRLTNEASVGLTGLSVEHADSSTISRDGRRIAYTWWKKDRAELRLLDISGGNQTMRTVIAFPDAGHWIAPFDWSPDHKSLVAIESASGDKNNHIILVSVIDGTRRVLKSTPYDVTLAKNSFSPDGQYVAYGAKRSADTSLDVFVMRLADGTETPIATSSVDETPLGWTPDGKTLIFASKSNDKNGIWRQELTAAKPQGAPSLLADGTRAESQGITREGTIFYSVNTPSMDVYVGKVDFTTAKVLSPPTLVASEGRAPIWSVDGRYLAYLTERGSSTTVVIRSARASTAREFTPNLRMISVAVWSGDGTLVVNGRDQNNNPGIFRVDPENPANVSPLLLGEEAGYPLAASADGKTLFLVRGFATDGGKAIIARDLETGIEKESVRAVADGVAISPDTRLIALTERSDHDASLLVVPVGGGTMAALLHVQQPQSLGFVTWSGDSSSLIFMRLTRQQNAPTRRDLMRIPVVGGQPVAVEVGPEFAAMQGASLRVHPDGKQLAFNTLNVPKSEVWALKTTPKR